MRTACVVVLLLLQACQREPASSPPAPTSPAPAAALRARVHVIPVPIAVPVAQPAATDAVPLAHLVTPVPPVVVDDGRVHRTYDALRPFVFGDVPDADHLAHIILDNRIDAGDVPGRFAEACYLAQRGLHAEATAVLQALADAKGCPACVDALANVADPRCPFDAAARALATSPSPLRVAATEVLGAIGGGDPAPIARHVDRAVRFAMACSVCDAEPAPETISTRAASAVAAYLAKPDRLAVDGYHYTGPALLFCDARCCSGPIGFLSHSAHTITAICFAGRGRAPKLARIEGLAG